MKYDVFASLDVNNVYGELLNNSLNYQATYFSSAILTNLGSGDFMVNKLPVRAQFSSVNDFLVGDYNKDDINDILLIGNMHHSEIETPRNDAGIGALFLGSESGEYTFSPVNQSGLYLLKDRHDPIDSYYYVCENNFCKIPVQSIDELFTLIDTKVEDLIYNPNFFKEQ